MIDMENLFELLDRNTAIPDAADAKPLQVRGPAPACLCPQVRWRVCLSLRHFVGLCDGQSVPQLIMLYICGDQLRARALHTAEAQQTPR